MICSANDCEKLAKGVKTVRKTNNSVADYKFPQKPEDLPPLSTFGTKVLLCREHLDDPPMFVE